jgi:hypothetical protein
MGTTRGRSSHPSPPADLANGGVLDPDDLKSDWADELSDGSIHGLVLSEQLHAELGLGADYANFQPGHRWIPYRGEKPGNLTAD